MFYLAKHYCFFSLGEGVLGCQDMEGALSVFPERRVAVRVGVIDVREVFSSRPARLPTSGMKQHVSASGNQGFVSECVGSLIQTPLV